MLASSGLKARIYRNFHAVKVNGRLLSALTYGLELKRIQTIYDTAFREHGDEDGCDTQRSVSAVIGISLKFYA